MSFGFGLFDRTRTRRRDGHRSAAFSVDFSELNDTTAGFPRRVTPDSRSNSLDDDQAFTPNQGRPMYKSLNESRKEIRLLRILRETEDSQHIHCTLETHSLEDFSPPYRDFCANLPHGELRKDQIANRWVEQQLSPNLAQLPAIRRVNSAQPSSTLYRFSWGDFATLSYVWGNKGNTRHIFLNGRKISVTANLFLALHEFRNAGEFNGGFRLWVDALCINQADLEERSRQIQMMRVIYGRAWTVLSWLGPEDRRSTSAFDLVRDIASFKDAGCVDQVEAWLRNDPGFLGSRPWLALQELMDRQYWFRLWVIQEVTMGGTSTWLRCGSSLIDWTTFCHGITVLQDHLWLVKDYCLELDIVAARTNSRPTWRTTSLHLVHQDLSMLSREPRTELTFGRLLDLANTGNCVDKRDKVYALLGLMAPSVASRLRPDYTIPASSVYTAATRAFIESHNHLDPLAEGNPWGPSGCPSWVADWQWSGRIRYARVELPVWGPTYLGLQKPTESIHASYAASASMKGNARFSDDGRYLTCTGIIVDKISALSARGVGYFAWARQSIQAAPHWTSIYSDTAEALYRTLVADRVSGGKRATARHAAILSLPHSFAIAGPLFEARGWRFLAGQEGYYFRFARFLKANENFPLGNRTLSSYFHFYHSNEAQLPEDASEFDFTEAYSCFDRTSKKRRLMLTERGFMGWAPDNIYGEDTEQTRVGDLVVVVFGCSTPLVVRPVQEGMYQVLGEAYVQGLMEGEAIQELDEGRFQREELVFC